MFWFPGPQACGILASQPGIEPTSPALEGEILTTGPPGKVTWLSCTQFFVTPWNCSLPGSSVHGILQARVLEWVAIPFCRGSSWLRDWTWVFCIACRFFTIWATREDPAREVLLQFLFTPVLVTWAHASSLPRYFDGSFPTFGKMSKHPAMTSMHIRALITAHLCLSLGSTLFHSVVVFWVITFPHVHSHFSFFHLLGQLSFNGAHLMYHPLKNPRTTTSYTSGVPFLRVHGGWCPRSCAACPHLGSQRNCVSFSSDSNMITYYGAGEDSCESLGLQGDQISYFYRNQPWVFTGRTDAKAEAPVLWTPDAKSQLIGKYPDAGKDRWQEEKGVTDGWMV